MSHSEAASGRVDPPESAPQGFRRIKLVLQYDGANYHGWQRQADVPTIQAVVEDTLATIVSEAVVVHASGRTDAGVHALGQVAHFDTKSRLPAAVIARALNARLPEDIAIARADDTPADFHARFSAKRKTYCYQFHVGEFESPFFRRHFEHVFRELDVARMRDAAKRLVGRHDFRSFAAEMHAVEDTVRTLYSLRVLRIPSGSRVFATGDGFLMHMVRTLAGTLLKVGLGKLDLDEVDAILAAKDRRRAPAALPPHGLFLWRVDY